MLRNHNRVWYRRRIGVWLVVLCIAGGLLFAAEREYREPRQRPQRPTRTGVQTPRPEDVQKEQLQKEAQATYKEIEKPLTQILEKVNKNQKPSADLINQAAAALEKNKRFSVAYEDNQRADYMLLQAWTSFYQGNPPDALAWSLRACKLDETSQDAWISQAVFSLLSDKRPLEPKIVKPPQNRQENGDTRRPPRRPENRPVMPMMPGMEPAAAVSALTIRKGALEFDLSALRSVVIKERLEQSDLQKEWASDIEYEAGRDALCLLFWQSEEAAAEKPTDANDVPQRPAKREVPNEPGMPGMPPGMPGMMPPGMPGMMGMPAMPQMSGLPEDSQKLGLKNQQQYFERLFEACKEHAQVKFVQVNTDRPQTAKKVAEQLLNDPEAPIAVPLVFASETGVEEKDYAGINVVGPIMVVVDKDKKIKYVGPAAYFVPAFMLTAVTGVELDLEKMNQPKVVVAPYAVSDPNKPAESVPAPLPSPTGPPPGMMPPGMPPGMYPPGMPGMPGMPPGMYPPGMPGMPPGMPVPPQPQKPVDPNAPPSATGAQSGQSAEKPKADKPRELSVEDEVIAQNLLREGQLHIEESRKLRGKNPEKGIEACRKILKEFVGTEYAEQARELLRRVPERYKQQYNITNEELGL